MKTKVKKGFVTVVAKTKETKLIKGSPFKNLLKIQTIQANIGANYGRSISSRGVKNLLSFEFEVGSLPYGEWSNDFIIEHKGEKYLRLQVFKNINTRYIDECGIEYTYSEVEPYLRSSTNKKQEEIGLLDSQQIKVRNFNIKNIVSINGKNVHSFLGDYI